MPDERIKNLSWIRLLAAISVLFSHSFLIAEGDERNEPVESLTGEILGIYGVFVFFIISGFLVTRSCLAAPSQKSYFWNRFLRVYPGYAASIIICLFVVCPLFTSPSPENHGHPLSLFDDFARSLFFLDNILLCDGAWFYRSQNGMGEVLNGVYWTIKIEVILYIILALLKKLNLLKPKFVLTLALGSTGLFLADKYPHFELWGLTFGMPGFFAGSFLFLLMSKREFKFSTALVFIFLLLVSGFFGLLPKLFPLLAAYPVLALGFLKLPDFDLKLRSADYSYGMYLFGWPVQQVLRSFVGNSMSGWTFFLLSVPLVFIFSTLSWQLIEKPCLRFKKSRGHS